MTQTQTRVPAVPRPRTSPEARRAPAGRTQQLTTPTPALDGLGQVTAMVRDGFTGLLSVHRSPRRAFLLAVWLVGIVGDAVTTLVLLNHPGHVEGNPSAVVGMDFLGIPGYVAVASTICLVFAVVSTGRPLGRVAQATALFLFAIAAGKIAILVNNLVLWWTSR